MVTAPINIAVNVTQWIFSTIIQAVLWLIVCQSVARNVIVFVVNLYLIKMALPILLIHKLKVISKSLMVLLPYTLHDSILFLFCSNIGVQFLYLLLSLILNGVHTFISQGSFWDDLLLVESLKIVYFILELLIDALSFFAFVLKVVDLNPILSETLTFHNLISLPLL